MSSLFQQVAERAGLPRVVSDAALDRALERVKLTRAQLTRVTLRVALDSIYSTLLVYHSEEEATRRRALLRDLAERHDEDTDT